MQVDLGRESEVWGCRDLLLGSGHSIVGSDRTQSNAIRHVGDSDIFTGTPILGRNWQKFLEGTLSQPIRRRAHRVSRSVYHWSSPDQDTHIIAQTTIKIILH